MNNIRINIIRQFTQMNQPSDDDSYEGSAIQSKTHFKYTAPPKNIRKELIQHAQSRTNMQPYNWNRGCYKPQQMLKKASAPYTENNLAQQLVKEGASKNHFKNNNQRGQVQNKQNEGIRQQQQQQQKPQAIITPARLKRDIFNLGSDSQQEDSKEESYNIARASQSSDQEEEEYNIPTSEVKKEFELSSEEDEVKEQTLIKGFVVPQNSINPGNARRREIVGAKNYRDFRHQQFEQDDPPEDDDYSSLVPPHNQQKNTLLAHQQHPGHLSHLSSSNCSPEVVQVPDNFEDYNSSEFDLDQSSLLQEQTRNLSKICKKCKARVYFDSLNSKRLHICSDKNRNRIIPDSLLENEDHNIAIMEEPEEMKVQLIGNIHYNQNRQNHREDTANVMVSTSSFEQNLSQRQHNSRYLNNENSRYARGEATNFRLDWNIYHTSLRSNLQRDREESIPQVTTTSLEDTATLSQSDITMLQPHHMINNNPSQMMPVQQSFSSRTRQQIDSSHYRRRLMAAIGNSNEEARINLVSGNPSRLLNSSQQFMIQETNDSQSSSENNINQTQIIENQSAASTNHLDLTQDGSGHLMQYRIQEWQQNNQGFMRAMNEANTNRRHHQPDLQGRYAADQRMNQNINIGQDEEDEIPRTQTVFSTNLINESTYGQGHATPMISLGMPRMQDYQQIHNLNPNARAAAGRSNNQDDQAVSTGLLSRNSSTSDEMPERYRINRQQINQVGQYENNQTDDDEEIRRVNVSTSLNMPDQHSGILRRRSRTSDSQTDEDDHQLQTQEEEEEKIFIFQRPVEAFVPFRGAYADFIQDEAIDMRLSARESSIGRSLNMMRPNQQQPLNLRPRLQPFAQNHIHNESEDSYHDHIETAIYNNSTNSNRMMRRTRIQPFGLIHPGHANMIANDDEEDEWSSRSYNYIGDEDATFIDHIVNRANNFRNFDDYEALLNLDDNIVQSIPQRYIDQLPKSEFTEGNKENFTEENKSCTICMCPYELQEEFMILPCLHRFHSPCITEWFARRNTCPNCKDRVLDHFDNQNQQCSMIKPPGRCLDNNQSSSIESNIMRIVRSGGASGRNYNNQIGIEEEEKNDVDGEQEDDDLMNTQVQYVQGQSIQRFVPRARFGIEQQQQIENRNNNLANTSIRNMMNTLSQYTERINNAAQAYNFSQNQLQNQQDQMSQIRSHLQQQQQNQLALNRNNQGQQQRPMIDFDVTSSEDMAGDQDYTSSLL